MQATIAATTTTAASATPNRKATDTPGPFGARAPASAFDPECALGRRLCSRTGCSPRFTGFSGPFRSLRGASQGGKVNQEGEKGVNSTSGRVIGRSKFARPGHLIDSVVPGRALTAVQTTRLRYREMQR